MNPINLFASSEFESKEVINSIGHKLGKIKDIVIDTQRQKILLVVVADSDFKNDNFVLPWPAVRVNPNTKTCMVEVNKETILKAPEINYDELLKGNRKTLYEIFSYYGFPENWDQEEKTMESIVTSEPVKDRHNAAMGSELSTKDVPEDDSKLSNEMDFDKLTGKSDK
ncbi:hypothetical protein BH23BAC1_BH23BAC1_51390 [soil metagenome]